MRKTRGLPTTKSVQSFNKTRPTEEYFQTLQCKFWSKKIKKARDFKRTSQGVVSVDIYFKNGTIKRYEADTVEEMKAQVLNDIPEEIDTGRKKKGFYL